MLTFRQLDDLPDTVVEIMSGAEQEILDDMAQQIAVLNRPETISDWPERRREILSLEEEYILFRLLNARNALENQMLKIFDEAATRTIESDNRIFRAAGMDPAELKDNPYLQQVVRAGFAKTSGEFRNLTRTTASAAGGQFERTLDEAHSKIVTGRADYQTAIHDAVFSLTEKGIAAITYPGGHTDYLDVATRRAVLTGVNQTAAEVQLANMQQMGSDLVETTAHPGARPEHALWQGRVFSVSGAHTKYPNFRSATGYGTGPGLCGWNCRHSFFPYFEGLSAPEYTADVLRDYQNRTVQFHDAQMDLYDATQYQRNMERQIRKWKRRESAMSAAGLDDGYAKARVRGWQTRMREFINETGLSRDYFRERAGVQHGTRYSTAEIAKTLSGNAFRVGNPGKPAKSKAPDVVLQSAFSDGKISIPQGAVLTDVRIIAGQSTRTPLRDTPRLNAEHGGDPAKWQKKVGTTTVDGNPIYLHWYENDGVMYEEKIKEEIKR